MPEIWPPEYFTQQQRERVPVLTQLGVHLAGQEKAGGPRAPSGLHRLQEHLQLFLLQPLQHRVGQRFQFRLRAEVSLGELPRLAHAAAPAASSAMRPAVRCCFTGLTLLFLPAAGRTAPPESPDEHRSFGPEHAGREEGFPAKKRACRPQIMKNPGSESRQQTQAA